MVQLRPRVFQLSQPPPTAVPGAKVMELGYVLVLATVKPTTVDAESGMGFQLATPETQEIGGWDS